MPLESTASSSLAVSPRVMNSNGSASHCSKSLALQEALEGLLERMLRRGVFGSGTIRVTVRDGAILLIEEATERSYR